MYYVELAQGTLRNRGVLVPLNDLQKYVPDDKAVYRSVYLYTQHAVDYTSAHSTLRKYEGLRALDNVIIDIDRGENSDKHTQSFAQATVFELEELGLSSKSMQVYFSGSGYHIEIPNSAFGFEVSKELPLQVKSTIHEILPSVDSSIYQRCGLIRANHSINAKTGLYKIPIDRKELFEMSYYEIHDLAKGQRKSYPYQELFAEGELEDCVVKKPNSFRTFNTTVEPNKIVPCVQALLREGPIEGRRHNTLLRIASHFRRNGIPSDYTKLAISHWNQESLSKTVIDDQVNSVYNGGYCYSCKDDILKLHCQTRCIYFKRKDYSINVKNATDMQQEFHDRMVSDFSGRIIDLGKTLGLDKESEIYPGELVTIFGPTGSNKTTLAQNLALGVDFSKDTIDTKAQIPTLFLSLELSAWYMHRRHLQIVSNLSKTEVNEDYVGIFEEHEKELSHIVVQTISPTLEQVQEKIRNLQPALVVVDYIDLIETPPSVRGEYEKVKYISHGLSNMAVNMDVIIIQISQISREYSRNEVLDLYAGKGSGAIENASRKVIGLNGQADSSKKTLNMYKNTDGELFSVDMEWRPSFRLLKV